MNEYLLYALVGIAAIALIAGLYWLIKVRPVYQRLKKSIRDKAKAVRALNEELLQADIYFQMKLAVGGNSHLPPLTLTGATTLKMKLVRTGEYSVGVFEKEEHMEGELSRRLAKSGEKRVVRGIQYIPPKVMSHKKELTDIIAKGIEELSKLTFPSVEDAEWLQKQEEFYQLGEAKPGLLGLVQHYSDWAHHVLWIGLRAIIVFNRDKVLGSLFPHPRGKLSRLRELDEEWEKLVGYQRELLKLLQKLPGSAEFLDAKEKARLVKKAEKERQEEAIASIEQAKERLEEAIAYIRLRHSEKSVSIGELPVTAGAVNLTLSMLEQYYEREMANINAMIQRGVEPHEIVGYAKNMVLPNLEGLFEEKAREVAQAEFTAGECQGAIRQLSEDAKRQLSVPKFLTKAVRALESEIPTLWSQAKWGEFDTLLLKEILEGLEHAEAFIKEAKAWFKDIDLLRARNAGLKVKEDRLKEAYGLDVPPSAQWLRMSATFESEALAFWAQARFDDLQALLDKFEEVLGEHQVKVSRSLTEADKEAGKIPPAEEIDGYQAKLAQIASAGQATESSQPSVRRHQQEEVRRPLSGKLVPYTTSLGVELMVDESTLEEYKRMDAKQAEADNARRATEARIIKKE